MKNRETRPLLIVVSAPSGAGKTTLCDRLLAEYDAFIYSISCTTRSPRGDEVDGRDYFFLDEEEFNRRITEGAFLEHAIVHGNKYGTLKVTVSDALSAGRSVLMDIDIQGAGQVRDRVRSGSDHLLKNGFVDIFIAPPSMTVLEERLRSRDEDSREVIERRLRNAEEELKNAANYQYVIVNSDLEKAYGELKGIIEEENKA